MQIDLLEESIKILDALSGEDFSVYMLGEESEEIEWRAARYLKTRGLIEEGRAGLFSITEKGRTAYNECWLEQDCLIASTVERGYCDTTKDTPDRERKAFRTAKLLGLITPGIYSYHLTADGLKASRLGSVEAWEKYQDEQKQVSQNIHISGNQNQVNHSGLSENSHLKNEYSTNVAAEKQNKPSGLKQIWEVIGKFVLFIGSTIIVTAFTVYWNDIIAFFKGLFQ